MLEFIKLGEYSFFPFIKHNLIVENISSIIVQPIAGPSDPLADRRLLIPANQSNKRYIYTIRITPINDTDDPRWISNNTLGYSGLYGIIYITAQRALNITSLGDVVKTGYLLFLEPYELEQNLNPDGLGNYYYKTGITTEIDIRLDYNQNVFIIPVWGLQVKPRIYVNIIQRRLPDLNYYLNKMGNVFNKYIKKIV